MERSSLRPWILAFALAACRNDSDSTVLAVQGVSVPDFGLWECNRPIEFAFDQPIDFASVSSRAIFIRTSNGVPAVGTFAPLAIDANGDGALDGIDERVVVFHPRCPESEDLSDAGFTPGLRYLVTLAGADSTQDPTAVLVSRSGQALAQTVVVAFETIADPARALHDERPGAPAPVVRAARASVGHGCYLELGEDPAHRVFFEAGASRGRTPPGFRAPLNLLGDRATHVAVVVVFDQAIRPTPANLAHLVLEYGPTLDSPDWRKLETRAELLSNCGPDDPAVRLVPLGSLPPGGFVRGHIDSGFQDFTGEATPVPLDTFALAEVETIAFTSLEPAGAIADELHEEFDFGPGSPLSLADPTPFLFDGLETAPGQDHGKVRTSGGRVVELAPLLGPAPLAEVELLPDGLGVALAGPVLAPLRTSAQPISPDIYLRTPALLAGQTLRLANESDPDRRSDFTIADARYDDAKARLTLVVGRLVGTLAEAVDELGGAGVVEVTLLPRFFRVRQGQSGADLLPDSCSVRILFQGAADDGTGHPEQLAPLVDWTADVTEFAALPPGALGFVRFQVEFDLDADDDGFDPAAEPLALDFLRLPMRF